MAENAVGALAALLGGLGLFLLGMDLMTEGLRLAAGPALERILAASTATRWRALGVGMLVTAVVQSSSAVTVATIGFVNAGLLQLGGALWVIFGANVGTTMTGWLVSLLGFGVKINAWALPLIGTGVALRVSGGTARRGALGTAIAGFGLLFLGIEVLKDGFVDIAQRIELPTSNGAWGVVTQVLVGVLLTVLMQSSSASLTVALSAAHAGLIGAQGAAAVVIGANIGTTVTALLAAMKATPNARRAASAHVLFNLLTAAVALLMLPWLVQALLQIKAALGLPPLPALTVALFHTIFNVMGVVLMWPLAPHLTRWLQMRFRSQEEDLARPRYLDPTVLKVPALALRALTRELQRLQSLAADALRTVCELPTLAGTALEAGRADDAQQRAQLVSARAVARRLQRAIGEFVTALQRTELGRDGAQQLPRLLRAAHYAEQAVEQAEEAAETLAPWPSAVAGLPLAELATLRQRALALLARVQDIVADDPAALQAQLNELEDSYAIAKDALLRAGAQGTLALDAMDAWLRATSELRRGLQQLTKGAVLLIDVRGGSDVDAAG